MNHTNEILSRCRELMLVGQILVKVLNVSTVRLQRARGNKAVGVLLRVLDGDCAEPEVPLLATDGGRVDLGANGLDVAVLCQPV